MTKPVRIQLRRTKGFRLQEASKVLNGLEAVNVTRQGAQSGMWGNWAAKRKGLTDNAEAVAEFRRWVDEEASEAWKGRLTIDLRGKNLACACALDEPCHADVELELANGPVRRSPKGEGG